MKTLNTRPRLRRLAVVSLAVIALGMMLVGVVYAAVDSDFAQCANKNPTLGQCDWIGSILQSGNSKYNEGMLVPQRLIFDKIDSGTTHTIEFDYMFTKGGVHAYDFIGSWDQAQATSTARGGFSLTMNQCDDLSTALTTECNNIHGSGGFSQLIDVPDDPFISKDGSTQSRIDAFEATYLNRTMKLYAECPIASASATVSHDVANGGDTGDSFAHITITYTTSATGVCAGAVAGVSETVLLEFAGHISMSGSPATNPEAWGQGLGAGSISGGPYHIKNLEFDNAGGSQDNQITAGFVIGSPNISTQQNGGGTIGVPHTDTATLTGTQGTPTGTIDFFLCQDTSAPYTPPSATSLPNGCASGGTQFGNDVPLVNGQATSDSFTPTQNGFYCWRAEYTSGDLTKYLSGSETNNSTECFVIQSSTAVTLSDFSARTEDGRGLTIAALGILGVALLGTLTFVFTRKR